LVGRTSRLRICHGDASTAGFGTWASESELLATAKSSGANIVVGRVRLEYLEQSVDSLISTLVVVDKFVLEGDSETNHCPRVC
jgi:hypothetical protein